MENVFMTLSQEFGLLTVIKSVIVCVVMMVVKKLKPNLSPKVEVAIRLILSIIIHLLFTIATNGEFLSFTKDVTCICGVSMIFSAVVTKKSSKENIEEIKTFLPDFDVDKIDELSTQVEQEEIVTTELIENEKDSFSIRN